MLNFFSIVRQGKESKERFLGIWNPLLWDKPRERLLSSCRPVECGHSPTNHPAVCQSRHGGPYGWLGSLQAGGRITKCERPRSYRAPSQFRRSSHRSTHSRSRVGLEPIKAGTEEKERFTARGPTVLFGWKNVATMERWTVECNNEEFSLYFDPTISC